MGLNSLCTAAATPQGEGRKRLYTTLGLYTTTNHTRLSLGTMISSKPPTVFIFDIQSARPLSFDERDRRLIFALIKKISDLQSKSIALRT